MSVNVGIVSISDDLHACIVATELKSRHGVKCHVFETNNIAFKGKLEWRPDEVDGPFFLSDNLNERCNIWELSPIWWRRFAQDQAGLPEDGAAHEKELINKDCRAALSGMFDCMPDERFVSPRAATDNASNKLLQLRAAVRHGLRIPRTLISTNRQAILDFVSNEPSCIVKPLGSTSKSIVFTSRVTPDVISNGPVEASPAVYQECIEGLFHLRINVFGEHFYTVRIKSNDLDWRKVLTRDIEIVEIDPILQKKLAALVADLGLSMGIIDIKLDPSGDPVFLEINPQGQFLFLEPLTGLSLTGIFADFLIDYARRTRVASLQAVKNA